MQKRCAVKEQAESMPPRQGKRRNYSGIFKSLFTLKTKLVFLFLVLALVPLVIVGAFSINTTENLIKALVLRQLENVAADKASILERWLEERKEDLQVIAGTSIVTSMHPEAIAPYLELIHHYYGVYNNLAVVSAADQLVVSTRNPSPTVERVSWDPRESSKTLFLSDISYLPSEKESAFTIAAPISEEGRIIGTLYGTVGTGKIIHIILRVALGKTGECYLVDKNGTFLAHKEPRRILAENISHSESFKNIFGNRDRTKTYLDYRNIEVLGTSQKVQGTDWYLVVEQDRDEAFQSLETLRRYIYVTIALAITSALLLTWVVSYHIVGPIRALSKSADTLALAQFDTTAIKTNRSDEIGVLCRAFGDMALKILERQDDLQQKFILKEAQLKASDSSLQQFKRIAERSEKFAALGRMGAAVAHEIRTPLTSLKLFMESVEAEIEISPEYTEDFSVAMGQITRIEAAINRLLDFTKPKALVFSRVGIHPLITEILNMIRPLATKQECIVATRIDDHLPAIFADEKRLEEALINLLINALEAMNGKGRIDVTVKQVHPDFAPNGHPYVRIDVKDTGPGIPAKNIDLIFDPFFTTKPAGTGLGLPMVFNTIERHRGRIRVQSASGNGTVFSIFLPTTPEVAKTDGKDTADR